MLSNIVGLYVTWGDSRKALKIKWIELATEQEGDYFDEALVKVVKPIDQM